MLSWKCYLVGRP